MEEIDIIELLKRVKEGKAPKEIQIETTNYTFTGIEPIEKLYTNKNGVDWINSIDICIYTKIKILDKPIIEELKFTTIDMNNGEYRNKDSILVEWLSETKIKINEIIKWINKENKDE